MKIMVLKNADEYFCDFTKLQPYMYEPCVSKESVKKKKKKKTTQERNDKIQKKTLVGLEILSCSYGKYKPMATHAESICCLDKYEISESYFKGILSFVFEIFLSSDLLRKK